MVIDLQLSEAERAFLRQDFICLHISCIYHRPELWTLKKLGLIELYDDSEPWKNKPSFFVRLTAAGKSLREELKP